MRNCLVLLLLPFVVSAAEPEAPAQPAPPAAAEAPAQPGGYDPNSPKKWFIIHTYSGFEHKVQESLRTRADAFGFADKIGQILIPTEEVVELRNGKKVTSKRLVYPGYVLVEMEMNDALWHEIKNTPRVTGFVGGGNAPVPLSPDEVNSILYRQASSAERMISLCCSSSGGKRSPSCCSSRVEPSMSVNMSVTAPVGRSPT